MTWRRSPGAAGPGTPRLLRALNDRSALELLLTRGPLTRAQLGGMTGLSKVTAAQVVERLEARGLVENVGVQDGGRGPNAQLYAAVPGSGFAVGVEVGPRFATASAADITGVAGRRVMVAGDDPVRTVHRAVVAAARAVDAPLGKVRQVVIGSPGVVDPATGEVAFAFDLPEWHRGLLPELRRTLPGRVRIENDANLAAVAEAHEGAANGVDDFALVWLGRGVGLAVVLRGRLYRGATGGAGEIGYLPVPGGRVADAASRDTRPSFSQLAAADAIAGLAREHGFAAGVSPGVPAGPSGGVSAGSAAEVVRAAVAEADAHPGAGPGTGTGRGTGPDARPGVGGAGAVVLEEIARRVASGVVAVCVVLDPALVVLAGEVGRAGGDALATRVGHHVARMAPVRPSVVGTRVAADPVLRGALLTAVADAREDILASTERPPEGVGGATEAGPDQDGSGSVGSS